MLKVYLQLSLLACEGEEAGVTEELGLCFSRE